MTGLNNEQALISVIVPVYNAEKYLKKCIKSLQLQTYRNLQIILVDDGSTDSSLSICKHFAKKDYRIEVIHQKNGGVSSAKNRGLSVARGDHITFLDSDDWLQHNAINNLYKAIVNNDSELAIGTTINYDVLGQKPLYTPVTCDIDMMDKKLLAEYIFGRNNYFPPTAGKLFKTSTILCHDLRFDEEMSCGEDGLFNFQYIKYIKKVSIISDVVYYYNRLNSYSLTTKYYPDLNQWLLSGLYAREKLFSHEELFGTIMEKRINYALVLFRKLCRDYSNRNLPTEIAVWKIKDTCEMYSFYLEMSKSIIMDDDLVEIIPYCYESYKNTDFESIYRAFNLPENCDKKTRIVPSIKHFVKHLVVICKTFWVFRICVKSMI